MDDSTQRSAKWLIGLHSLVAISLATMSRGSSEFGGEFWMQSCAVLLTTAALLLARRDPNAPSATRRIGALVMLGAYATFTVRACGPEIAHAQVYAAARTSNSCGNQLLGIPVVPFVVAAMWSKLAALVASLPARVVRAISIAAVGALVVGSMTILVNAPQRAASAREWIEAQPVVATLAPVPLPDRWEHKDRVEVDHGLWLNRSCGVHFGLGRHPMCRFTLSPIAGDEPDLGHREIGHPSPRELDTADSLRVRWLPGPNVWFVESVDRAGVFSGALAFDSVTYEPVTLGNSQMRGVAGPSSWSWILFFASPIAAIAAWLLARRRGDLPTPTSWIDANRGEAATLVTLTDAARASLPTLPPGPAVFEIDPSHAPHFRNPHSQIVRRVMTGSLAQWRMEAVFAPLVPWVAAAVAAYCSLSVLAAWG
jgi:hypothetical protein